MKTRSIIAAFAVMCILGILNSCQEKVEKSKLSEEASIADKKVDPFIPEGPVTRNFSQDDAAMSGCDSTCKTSCCTYPDKEGGCLCAEKSTDCTAHCCAAHLKGGNEQSHNHGGGHDHHLGERHGEHKQDVHTKK